MARVLVIDNSNNGVLKSKEILENEGYNIEGCEDFESSIPLAKEKEPDLIILDLDTNSIDDVKRVLNAPETASIPLIVSITNKNNSARIKCIVSLWNGARDYILKPINKDELIQRVHAQMKLS